MSFAVDPLNPTDAELSAAIERGLADGTLIDAVDWMAEQAQADLDAIEQEHRDREAELQAEAEPELEAG